MQFLFGVLLLTSMSVEAAARSCPALFEDGYSFWRVQVPAERTRPIDFAATELTNVIARISGGVALGIVSTEECGALSGDVDLRIIAATLEFSHE